MSVVGYESKSFHLNPSIEDAEKGIVHAVVSVFGNLDLHGDVVCRGAFTRSIERSKSLGKFPPGVFHHDWTKPVAKTLHAWEDDEGLHVLGQFNLDTQRGRETFSDIKAGIITEYSFGFQVTSEKMVDGKRHILDLDWYEWSPVLLGANPKTYTAGIKSLAIDSCQEPLRIQHDLVQHQFEFESLID